MLSSGILFASLHAQADTAALASQGYLTFTLSLQPKVSRTTLYLFQKGEYITIVDFPAEIAMPF